jgi:Beta-lactamase enzyme family
VRRAAFLLAAVALLLASPAADTSTWRERTAAAARYLETRAGVESFALIDGHGRIHGHRRAMRAPSASLLKVMALVSYLNLGSVRNRALRESDRRLLGPMIRWSDNATASTVLRRVGARRLYRLAERAEMQAFRFAWPIWGQSTTSAQDQARFFYRPRACETVRGASPSRCSPAGTRVTGTGRGRSAAWRRASYGNDEDSGSRSSAPPFWHSGGTRYSAVAAPRRAFSASCWPISCRAVSSESPSRSPSATPDWSA